MTREAVILSLQAIAAKALERALEQCPPDGDLKTELGGDDLDLLEITMDAEERFGIELSNDEYLEWKTLEQLADLLMRPPAKEKAA